MNTENKCIFVSSRGILNSCMFHSYKPISSIHRLIEYNFTEVEKDEEYDKCYSVYVCLSAIKEFMNIINALPFRFVLVTGDCDESCYEDVLTNSMFEKLINNPKLVHWFSQNCVSEHEKLTKLPIGLDYHTISNNMHHSWGPNQSPLDQERELILLKSRSPPFYERTIKAYANYHFFMTTRYGMDRVDAKKSIPENLVFYEPSKVPRIQTWTNQVQYSFVISPHGNGFDCHRTWEALLLGCIPIMKKSRIDSLFKDLPVLIVNDWSDVTQELLDATIIEFKQKHDNNEFNYEKLLLDYWMKLIHDKCV